MPEAGKGGLDLESFLPYRISLLANGISRHLAGLYAERFGLSISEWRVMAVLGSHPGLSADGVCERTAMDKVAVSRAVTRLRKRAYVRRNVSVRDRRRSELSLAPAGARCYRRIVPLAQSFEASLVDKMTAAERAGLDRAMERLSDALARMAADQGA